jgi:hypothetical protein
MWGGAPKSPLYPRKRKITGRDNGKSVIKALEGFVLMDELIVKILHGEKIGHIKIL